MSDDAAGVIGRFLSRRSAPFAISLGVLLADARRATGRVPETGAIDPAVVHDEPPLYAGVAAYLLIVDAIGECLRPVGRTSTARAAFLRALELFTDLPESHREALYAFRCAWLHPYAPVTGEARPAAHRFHVSTDGSAPVAEPQDVPWDGDLRILEETTATPVDIRSFGGLVEEMYAHLCRLHARRGLEVALPGGARELTARSRGFWTPR